MPVYEIEANGKTYEIDAPKPPSRDEALSYIDKIAPATDGTADAIAQEPQEQERDSNSALGLAAASRIAPVAEFVKQGGRALLAAPNAPRVIQRTIGAGVRAAATATGAAIGGVPGAIGGAAMSQGLTPTQQTIRSWIGHSAPEVSSAAVESAAGAGDAVVNYIKSMGADVNNLKGAALEYAKKAGRAIIYDASGKASLVPAESAPVVAATRTAAPAAVSRVTGAVSRGLSVASGAQGALDLAQMAEPDRKDIGFFGIGGSVSDEDLVKGLIEKRKMSPFDAARAVSKGKTEKFMELMKPYMKASVK